MPPKRKAPAGPDEGGFENRAGPNSQRQAQASQQQQQDPRAPGQQQPAGIRLSKAEIKTMTDKIKAAKERAGVEQDKVPNGVLTSLPLGEPLGMAGRVMRAMLCHHTSKPGEPVKRLLLSDAATGPLQGLKGGKNLGSYGIALAQYHFISQMGLDMLELVHLSAAARNKAQADATRAAAAGEAEADVQAAKAAAAGAGQKEYVLVSVLPSALRTLVQGGAGGAHFALHMMVLEFINLSGNRIEHDALLNHLREVGYTDDLRDPDDDTPPAPFGSIKDEIERMVKRRYLSVESKGTGDSGAVYVWGEAAVSEFPGATVKNFFEAEMVRMQDRINNPAAFGTPGGSQAGTPGGSQAGPSPTQAGPSDTQPGPSGTRVGPSRARAGPSRMQPGTQAGTQPGTQPGTQAGTQPGTQAAIQIDDTDDDIVIISD